MSVPVQNAAREDSPLSFSTGERWGTVDDVAALLEVSRDFVYAHWRDLGGRKLAQSPKAPIRFRLEDVLAATSCEEVRGPEAETPAAMRRRRPGSGTGAPLLPIRGSKA